MAAVMFRETYGATQFRRYRRGWRVLSDHRSGRADAVDLAWGTGWVLALSKRLWSAGEGGPDWR
jgi:hypothetical protein